MRGTVGWIHLTPVKGLAMAPLAETALTLDGAPGNRRFALADARGLVVNGKRLGVLSTVTAAFSAQRGELTLRLPDGTAEVGAIAAGPPVGVRMYGRHVPAVRVSDALSAALSDVCGEPLTLVEVRRGAGAVDRGRRGGVSLLSSAALASLASAAGLGAPLDARRFRMLFGIDGVAAHAEDAWVGGRVAIGDAVVRIGDHTGRCLVTSRDPDTGVADLDVLELLRRTRPADTGEPLAFGVHGAVEVPGIVRLGDPVRPLSAG